MSKKKISLTVENAKVVNTLYKFYNIGQEGYLKCENGLVFVRVAAVIIDVKNCVVSTSLKDANDKVYERSGSFGLYRTKEGFESSDPMKPHSFYTIEVLTRADYNHLCECQVVKSMEEDGREYIYMKVWTFENGEAIETPIVVNSITIEEGGKWHLLDGCLPEKFWESREDAYGFNEYKIIDSDGEEFIEEGAYKRLALNPEQWKIVNQMRDLYKKATDAGIKFLWDRDNCGEIEAINMENVKDYGYDAESNDGGDLVRFKKVPFASTGFCFYDYCGCDDGDAFVLNPTPRQKKEWLKTHPESAQ